MAHVAGQERKNIAGLYFPLPMLEEMLAEAKRLDRPLAWVVQRAWKLARKQLQAHPSQAAGPATCARCGMAGHRAMLCPQRRRSSGPRTPQRCGTCRQPGHNRRLCKGDMTGIEGA